MRANCEQFAGKLQAICGQTAARGGGIEPSPPPHISRLEKSVVRERELRVRGEGLRLGALLRGRAQPLGILQDIVAFDDKRVLRCEGDWVGTGVGVRDDGLEGVFLRVHLRTGNGGGWPARAAMRGGGAGGRNARGSAHACGPGRVERRRICLERMGRGRCGVPRRGSPARTSTSAQRCRAAPRRGTARWSGRASSRPRGSAARSPWMPRRGLRPRAAASGFEHAASGFKAGGARRGRGTTQRPWDRTLSSTPGPPSAAPRASSSAGLLPCRPAPGLR